MPELLIDDRYPFRHRGTPADEGVIEQIFVAEDYHLGRLRRGEELRSLYERSAASLIIDCGAYIGASALWFAVRFPNAKIVAIEPEARNFELLARNVAPFANVTALHAAIGPERGRALLTDPGEGEWGFRTCARAGTADKVIGTVEVVSLADVLGRLPPGLRFILKIDIEGAERELFGSNTAGLDEFALIIIELHDWLLPGSASSRSFLKWHGATDRDFVCIGENVFSIRNP